MSFLKKFFFKEEKKIMMKAPERVQGDFLCRIKFQVRLENTPVSFTLYNISQNGLAFFIKSFKKSFTIGSNINAKVVCGEREVCFNAEVVRITDDLVGAKVVSNNIDYGVLIKHYFKLELAALKSSIISSDRLEKDPDGTPTWVVSGDNCELYYVVSDTEGLVKYHVSLFGNVIQRSKNKALHYREVWSEDVTDTAYKGSDLLKDINDTSLIIDLVSNSITFVSMLQDVDENIKELVICELKLALKETSKYRGIES